MRAIISCCVVMAMACGAFAEAPVADEPIEITFEDLDIGGIYEREKLPERITSIVGKLVRIVGWSDTSDVEYDEDYPWFGLRPELVIPNWEPPFSGTAIIEPYDETPPHAQVEVTGTFVLQELRDEHDRVFSAYRIKGARIKVLKEYYE